MRAIALGVLLMSCSKPTDSELFTASMESNQELLRSPGPSMLPRIIENLEYASRLAPPRPAPGLKEEFSRSIEALRRLSEQNYTLDQVKAQCQCCHTRFKNE